jgi:hypothetical protein
MRLLAEHGQLPAQDRKNGYGISTMLNSMGTPEPTRTEIGRLIRSVVTQGREYPHLEKFATDIESPEVLEGLQRLWRQISEGGHETPSYATNVTKVARDAELAVNSRIDHYTRFKELVLKPVLPWMPLVLLLVLAAYAWHAKRVGERTRLLQVSNNVLRLRDHVLVSRLGEALSDSTRKRPEEIEGLSDQFAKLREQTLRLEVDIREEIRALSHNKTGLQLGGVWVAVKHALWRRGTAVPVTGNGSMLTGQMGTGAAAERHTTIATIVQRAWEIAGMQFMLACAGRVAPELKVGAELSRCGVGRFPAVLVALLQQWFYNVMKKGPSEGGVVEVRVSCHLWSCSLSVSSPGVMPYEAVQCLVPHASGERAAGRTGSGSAQAFMLIREIADAAFGRRPRYWWQALDGRLVAPVASLRSEGLRSMLTLRLPLRKGGK